MDRADARREARADRRQLAQNPYGSRPPRKKSNNPNPKGIWGLIKSWSFFGQGEQPNGEELDDYDSDETAQGGAHLHPENSSLSDNSTSGTETGSVVSSQNAPSTVAHQVRPSFRRHRMPGEFIRASSRTPTPGPGTMVHMNALAQAVSQEQHEAAQTQWETPDSPTVSVPGSFEAHPSSQKDESNALVRLGQPEPEPKPDQSVNRTANLDQPGLNGSTDVDEPSPSPVPTYGLPPFRSQFAPPPVSSPVFGPIPLPEHKGPLTVEEKAELRKRIEERNYEIRKFLDIDYNELYEPGAWDELLRYNRVKVTPPPPEEGDLVKFDDDLPAETALIKPGEKEFDPSKDPNEGYTPEELMVNPYQRISAFRGRSRHILRRANNPPPRPKPIPPAQTSIPTSALVIPLKPETITLDATLKRHDLLTAERESLPTTKKSKRGSLMARLDSNMKKIDQHAIEVDREPISEKSDKDDYGILPDVGVYTNLNLRRSQPLLVSSKGAVADPPRARPYKADSSEGDMDLDENLESGRIVKPEEEEDADMEQRETGQELAMDETVEGQEDDMVDETPQPITAKRAKKRPAIRAPDMLRPKNSMHSPINPSPLRFMSKFAPDSPETTPIAPLGEDAMQRDDENALSTDALPAYTLPVYSFAPGSLALVKPTRSLMLAMERAKALSTHVLPDYSLGQGASIKRSSRLRERGLVPPKRAPASLRGVTGRSKRTNDSASAAKSASSTSNDVPPLRLPPVPSTNPSELQEPPIDISTPLPAQKQSRLQPAASPHTRTNEWASAGLQKPPQTQPASVPSIAPPTSGFNWGAAGFKAPSKPVGSWSCDVCMVSNDAAKEKCIACESPRPAAATPAASTSSPQPAVPTTGGFNWGAAGSKIPSRPTGSWSCDVCMITNDAAKEKCVACENPRPEAAAPTASASSAQPAVPATSGFNWGAAGYKAPSKPTGSWSCGVCMVSNDATKEKCVCCETPRS